MLLLALLVRHFGLDALTAAVAQIAWWQFVLVCLVYGGCLVLDTLGWRATLVADRPPFLRLLAARCAGQAVNVVTALGGVVGESIKAWLLRRDIPYEASVPSLILDKTAEVVAQALLLATGILVAWGTGVVGWSLIGPMCFLFLVEVAGVGGFILVQVAGGVGRVGRLLGWLGRERGLRDVDGAIRSFYGSHPRSFLLSVGWHFASWLLGTLEVLLIARSLQVAASLPTATVVEALGSGVRFATFFVPASLGTLESANAAIFAALGWAAGAGLAFSLVRRGRQAVWVGLGLTLLWTMGTMRTKGMARVEPADTRAD